MKASPLLRRRPRWGRLLAVAGARAGSGPVPAGNGPGVWAAHYVSAGYVSAQNLAAGHLAADYLTADYLTARYLTASHLASLASSRVAATFDCQSQARRAGASAQPGLHRVSRRPAACSHAQRRTTARDRRTVTRGPAATGGRVFHRTG